MDLFRSYKIKTYPARKCFEMSKFLFCNLNGETIHHLYSRFPVLPSTNYQPRHNRIDKYIEGNKIPKVNNWCQHYLEEGREGGMLYRNLLRIVTWPERQTTTGIMIEDQKKIDLLIDIMVLIEIYLWKCLRN